MNTELLKSRFAELNERPGANTVALDAMESWLEVAEPVQRVKINPLHVAEAGTVGANEIISEFLYGVRAGVFDLQWNVHCPHCNMITSQHDHLLKMESSSNCKMCDTNFEVDFVERVEVSFSLTKEIDDAELPPFCLPPPVLKSRYNFAAPMGESMDGVETLSSGEYRYYCPITQARGLLKVEGDATDETQVLDIRQLPGPYFNIEEAAVRPGPVRVNYVNAGHPAAGFFLHENILTDELPPADLPITLSGMQLYHIPAFQELFGDQVLSARERLKIASVSILFTDIVSSTQLYESMGDAPAYNAVRDHFDILFKSIEEDGGVIVKTIGDAVMASFRKSSSAIRAFAAAAAKFEDYNRNRIEQEKIRLKGGLHGGAAILVNLNGHLDYFGSNINRAARFVDVSGPGQISFSRTVLDVPETGRTLRDLNIASVKKKTVHLKGLGDETVYLADVSSN